MPACAAHEKHSLTETVESVSHPDAAGVTHRRQHRQTVPEQPVVHARTRHHNVTLHVSDVMIANGVHWRIDGVTFRS